MIFRLSQKLATKLKEGRLPSLPLDEDPFVDWSAHLFTVDRVQYIIVSNTKSFYSVVLFGKGITDGGTFIARALSALREFMEDDGQTFVYHRRIAPPSRRVRFAKALNRSTTGTINQVVGYAKWWLANGLSPYEVGFRLNDFLLSAIAPNKAASCGTPNEAFRAMGGDGGNGEESRPAGDPKGPSG